MNYYIESDLDDYGVRDILGNAGENLTWILKNREYLDLSYSDKANILRCCQYKIWSSSMCKWLDSMRMLNDDNYAEHKTELKIKSVQKKIERETNLRIAALQRKVNALDTSIRRFKGVQ